MISLKLGMTINVNNDSDSDQESLRSQQKILPGDLST